MGCERALKEKGDGEMGGRMAEGSGMGEREVGWERAIKENGDGEMGGRMAEGSGVGESHK